MRIPEPLAVEISAELAKAVDAEFAPDVSGSIGLVFGSTYKGRSLTQLPKDYALSPDQREAAARILAFDILGHEAAE